MEAENQKLPSQAPIDDFSKVVAESKAALIAETNAQVASSRGRGRPPGSKNVKGRENETDSEAKTSNESSETDKNAPPIDLKPLIKDVTKIPFSVSALKFKMPELELDDKETETPTYYLNRVLNFYLPEMEKKDPRAFAFTAWIISMIALGVKKFMLAKELKKRKIIDVENLNAQTPPQENPISPAPPSPPSEGTGAGAFFKGRLT